MSDAAATRKLPWAVAFALTTIGYALLGLAAEPLIIPPGHASPLYPAAGLALGAVLLGGPSMAWAAGLGAGALWAGQMMWRSAPGGPAATQWLLPLAGAIGAALQAYLGGVLMRRRLREPLALSEPVDVANFIGAAALACVVGTTIVNSALFALGRVRAADLPFALSSWWIGDVLGILIAVPVILAANGQPREAWVARRASVALTLSALTLFIGFGIHHLVQEESERRTHAFRRDAESASNALVAELREPLRALETLHGLFLGSDDISAEEMRLATRAWVASGQVEALGWNVPVRPDDLAAFEASVRAADHPGFRVADATRLGTQAPSASGGPLGDREAIVLRDVQPMRGNEARLGGDAGTDPATRAAVERARASGEPVASAGMRVPDGRGEAEAPKPAAGTGTAATTGAAAGGAAGGERAFEVVVYQALYQPRDVAGLDPAQRAAALRGLVSVAVRPQTQLERLARREPTLLQSLAVCVIDASAGAPPQRLAGRSGCETASGPLDLQQPLAFAGRDWKIVVGAAALGGGGSRHNGEVWLFSLVALIATAMLGGFLLTTTARTRRIELGVRERTAALQAEVQDRQAAENALRESEQRFRNILANVPIGVVYTDLNGSILQANLRFCELAGRSETELLGVNVVGLTHPDDIAQELELGQRLVRGEVQLYRHHKRLVRPDGKIVTVEATVCLLQDAAGQPRSAVSVVEDVTEHRLLEEAERRREAAEAANRAKSEFLSRMSHELRTPLNAMLGFAQLLELDLHQPLTTGQKSWVVQIQQAGWHLLEMINDVLDVSRIESGNLRLRAQALDLAELVAGTVAMVEGEARQRGITIVRRLDLGSASLIGDPTRVKQILINLLTNAVKYNTDAGRVDIAARMLDAEHVEVVVSDTGLGMTPEQLAGLFQPFNRLGRERSALAGTGIGLVISQRLAELMGGSLVARSRAGKGSSFVLTLPCSAEPDTVRSDLEPLDHGEARYPRRDVCYVEDNETNVEVMRSILAQRPQIELRIALTGRDGLAAIRARRPDLLLLDLHLPDMEGLDLLHRLRAAPATRDLPVIVVSANALAEQISAAFDAGCDRYLTKPVGVAEVLAVVDELLMEASAPVV